MAGGDGERRRLSKKHKTSSSSAKFVEDHGFEYGDDPDDDHREGEREIKMRELAAIGREGMAKADEGQPLHMISQPTPIFNRLHIISHFALTLALLYYRATRLHHLLHLGAPEAPAWALISAAELLLAFLWTLAQAYRWCPVYRTVFPERLPEDDLLPPIDIFICTADPEKEPAIEVMNTLVSAMCLDYPSDKLNIYLSDDGGSPLTLYATRLAYVFAASWLPFCKRNKIQTICPEAYFAGCGRRSTETFQFQEEYQRIQLMYEDFKENIMKAKDTVKTAPGLTKKNGDYNSHIEIIQNAQEANTWLDERVMMPLLVYVSREKRKAYPHHFKAGALNVLLRASSIMSNSPYILVLDCDMYANNPASTRQALCFHLDPHFSPRLAFVQFPQNFFNISKNDIYCGELRQFFKVHCYGCDGLTGPILCGTGFYIKRDALYGVKPGHTSREEFSSADIMKLKQLFGASNEFIASLSHNRSTSFDSRSASSTLLSEANLLASSTYESFTQWGEQVGFFYDSVVEDYFTGYHLHCRGWISTYYCPSRIAFLGRAPISFSDSLVQSKRWMSGLLQVAFSKFCPLTYGLFRTSVLQSMCYASLAFQPLYSFPLLCYGTIPQLCLLNNIALFPPVSSLWFAVFAVVYASSLSQHLIEVLHCGGFLTMWLNEQRFRMITSITSYPFACLNVIMKFLSLQEVNFDLTSKVDDDDQIKRYEDGIFDFQGPSLILVPLTTLTILNIMTLIGVGGKLGYHSTLDKMFGQLILSVVISIISYPVLEGMTLRRDKGQTRRTPQSPRTVSCFYDKIGGNHGDHDHTLKTVLLASSSG